MSSFRPFPAACVWSGDTTPPDGRAVLLMRSEKAAAHKVDNAGQEDERGQGCESVVDEAAHYRYHPKAGVGAS